MRQINALADERQRLWRLAGKQKLTDEQRERIGIIGSRLARLWDTHRVEVASCQLWTQLPTDRLHSELFSDFLNRSGGAGEMRVEDWDTMEYRSAGTALTFGVTMPAKKRVVAPQQHPDLRKKKRTAA